MWAPEDKSCLCGIPTTHQHHTWDVPINTFRTLRQTQGATNPQGRGYYESYQSLQKQLLSIPSSDTESQDLVDNCSSLSAVKNNSPSESACFMNRETVLCLKQSAIFMFANCLCSNWITITAMLIMQTIKTSFSVFKVKILTKLRHLRVLSQTILYCAMHLRTTLTVIIQHLSNNLLTCYYVLTAFTAHKKI